MLSLGLSLLMLFKVNAQVGIGTSSPESSAKLDITSATKGFLLPRMTGAQRADIVSPVAGLKIWCIDCGSSVPYGEAQIYNGAIWTNLAGGTIKSVIVPGTNTITGATSPIGIGTNTPNSSAMLDITSTTQGFLPPRMTGAQRAAIVSPVAGLEIWCTDCGSIAPYGEAQIYNGAIWTNLEGGTIKSVTVAGTNTSGGAISPIGIGTNTPASSAALEINSTSKGFLIPRMTSTERNKMEPGNSAAGLQVWCSDCNSGAGELSIFNGTNWTNSTGAIANLAPPSGGNAICNGTRPTVVKDISYTYNGITYTWMDRNLGASRAATSETDFQAYGCQYQWGRGNDGHASMTWISSNSGTWVSGTTSTTSSTMNPGNNLIVVNASSSNSYNDATKTSTSNFFVDWMTTQPSTASETRWQGTAGTNNPCPSGYRLPIKAEFEKLLANYNLGSATTTSSQIYNTPLKLTVSGARNYYSGFENLGSRLHYWTSSLQTNSNTANYKSAFYLSFNNIQGAYMNFYFTNPIGLNVRCIKN